MPRPQKHPNSGVYRARLVVPPVLRAAIGRAELFQSLDTKDPAEAKRRFPAVLAQLQARLDAARLVASGVVVTVPEDRLAALAGELYREAAARVDAMPGAWADADIDLDRVLNELTPGDLQEDVAPAFEPTLRDLDQARHHLMAGGLLPDGDSTRRMAYHLFTLRYRLARRRLQRARGDYGPAPDEAAYPVSRGATAIPAATAAGITTDRLLELYQLETQEQAKTHDKRRAALGHLKRAAGHDDAARIDKAVIRAMKTARGATGVTIGTVAADVNVLRPVWAWGLSNGHLPEAGGNPFSGMTPKGSKRHTELRRPFTDDEAARMLTMARQERGFLRWLPWLLAFSGCRLDEATGAAASDIRQERGVWILDIHDRAEGRTLKDGQPVRMVPLHPALLAEGLLGYVAALPPDGPLFPDLARGHFGKRGEMASKKLGRWMRGKVGITEKGKVAAHSWRHRLKDLMRIARIHDEAADAIMGHMNPRNAGAGYGDGWRRWPDRLAVEIAKLPSPVAVAGYGGP